MIRVAMAPQVTILWGFGDHYTKNILAIVGVALATTRGQIMNIVFYDKQKTKLLTLIGYSFQQKTKMLKNIDFQRPRMGPYRPIWPIWA